MFKKYTSLIVETQQVRLYILCEQGGVDGTRKHNYISNTSCKRGSQVIRTSYSAKLEFCSSLPSLSDGCSKIPL